MAKARQQYFADEASIAKDSREFAITPELLEKINSIEPWAQVNVIETVKVNWEALEPDDEKAVDVSVPLVEDTLYSTDTTAALSAKQWKVLYEYIQNISSRWRYLSNWNCVTWLAMTNPVDNPYNYMAWDYYVISVVAAQWGTNYRPNWSQYITWLASTTVETEIVKPWDYYTYDGTNWLLLINTAREIAVDSELSASSTNPVENRVVTWALNTKQNVITDLSTIRSGAAAWATALQPWDSLSQLTWDSDDITEGSTHLFMTTSERTKLSNQSWVNTWDETQTTIMSKLWASSSSTNWYLTVGDWNIFNGKQDAISDLSTIRDNATAGASAASTIATYWDIVTHDANEFASASSWALADTAVQPWDNVSVLTNDAWYVTDAYHDSTKQDTLVAGSNIQIASDWVTISATDTTYTDSDFDISLLSDSQWKRAEWDAKQDALVVWNNIQIAADWKTISATDTTYTAWPGISISNNNVISALDNKAVWGSIEWTLSNQTDLQSALDAKQWTLTAWANIQISQNGTISATDTTYTAGTWISIDANNVISNTQTSAEWWNISWTLSDQTDLQSALDAKQDDMVILSYGNSTWNDFITAYKKNWVVYCRASSNSNPAIGSQWRLAFMAYVNNADNPTEVEFQYYRSRSDHNSAANQLDEVYVYKLVPTSGWTWTVTQRNTAAKAVAWTWVNLTFGSGNMTIANTWVTSVNSQTWDVTLTIPTVPTNVSDFVNDAWYITANDLPTVDTAMSSTSTNAVQNNVIKNYVDTQVQEATSGAVSDTAYWSSWNWITGIAPSKNAVYDKISAMDTTISGKQDTISDLSTIRSWASAWATALQSGDNISELTNDSGFITKAVSDLTNYYTKSEVYTKAEVADYVANFSWFEVVATLPTTDIKTTIIYLLWPVWSWADRYEEYIYSNNTWIKIWETSVDLSPYFNKSTDNSDSITQGSTNLFLTSAERTKLSNTSGTNTGDETKTTIQTKLGASSASNDWYLTSTDWSTFNGKANVSDINTKTFYLSSTSDLTNAQAAYDWYKAGKNPIIIFNKRAYLKDGEFRWTLYFKSLLLLSNNANTNSYIAHTWLEITYSGDTVTTITQTDNNISWNYLKTDTNYSTPYTPQYDWSPATKKYVDDWLSGKQNTISDLETIRSNATAWAWAATTIAWYGDIVTHNANEFLTTDKISDTAYASSWNWVTNVAPSKNAVYDKISAMDTTISGKANASDVNTRTFYIASTSDTAWMQRVINYLDTGNNPIVDYWDSKYTLYAIRQEDTNKVFYFYALSNDTGSWTKDNLKQTILMITQSSWWTYSMTTSTLTLKDIFLSKTNTTSYTPTANYHPATKKYVDNTSAWKVNDTAYASSWNWVTTVAPSKNAVYDKISTMDTTISWKQDALATQTAYTSKGTASKVPQITTNSLWQVTGITEVNISYPSQVSDTAYASSWSWVTWTAPSKNAVYDKINAMDTTIGNKANTSDVLTKTNTTSYTPTANYHPATKKYVDDAVSQSSWWIQALPWSPIEIKYIWAWTQEQYNALSTYREDTIYHIV